MSRTIEALGISDGESCWFWVKQHGVFGIGDNDNGCSEVVQCNVSSLSVTSSTEGN